MEIPRTKAVVAPDLRELSWPQAVLVSAVFVAGYLLLDWMSFIYPTKNFNITPWNPQPALAIALLMVGGRRWLPAVFVATLIAALVIRGAPTPFAVDTLVAVVLTLGYFAIAQVLSTALPITLKLGSRRDVLRLIATVTAGSLIVGFLYTAILLGAGIHPTDHYLGAILRFWIGNSVGTLVTLPLFLMLLDPERRQQMKRMLGRGETFAQLSAIGIVLWAVFAPADPEDFKRFYLLFLPLIWIATRSGMAGTALAAALIQGGVIFAVQIHQYQTLTVFELQALLMALTITGFFLGVTVEERQRTALELRESLRLAAAGEMAAALAHELNQPLTALSSYAKASQLLAESRDGGGPQQLLETLRKLVSEATRAAEVVRRLRDFFSTGATQLHSASLARLVENVVESLRARTGPNGVQIQLRVTDPVPNVLIDSLQIEVVVRNLLENAIDAVADVAGDGRSVFVDIGADNAGSVRLTVTDSGPGITLDRMDDLFEPFSTTKATGMGMGLAISRAIVEGHGGTMWATPGSRGVIGFTLPLREGGDG